MVSGRLRGIDRETERGFCFVLTIMYYDRECIHYTLAMLALHLHFFLYRIATFNIQQSQCKGIPNVHTRAAATKKAMQSNAACTCHIHIDRKQEIQIQVQEPPRALALASRNSAHTLSSSLFGSLSSLTPLSTSLFSLLLKAPGRNYNQIYV